MLKILLFLLSVFFKDYLARLEAIRRQNFQERKELQRRMAGVRAPVVPSAQVTGALCFLFLLSFPSQMKFSWTSSETGPIGHSKWRFGEDPCKQQIT